MFYSLKGEGNQHYKGGWILGQRRHIGFESWSISLSKRYHRALLPQNEMVPF